MNIHRPTPLLGGLSPAMFMRRHWQRRPLLVRQAIPALAPPIGREPLFALAGRDDVESRLVQSDGTRWRLRRGPFARRGLPAVGRPRWTLLVQGIDAHDDAARALLDRFRFVPDARLDDLMISWASDGGGVGPHVDSYDVFLVQLAGRRRWRIGRVADPTPKPGLPLAILAHFTPEDEWVLEPGDLLYLPPSWGHDGVAEGECMTGSIGFRSDTAGALAEALLQRLADEGAASRDGPRYRDPAQAAVGKPGRIPPALQGFAFDALRRRLADRHAVAHLLGELLSEPKDLVHFSARPGRSAGRGVVLDRATRMLYDADSVYINGERYAAGGADAAALRRLADRRRLGAPAVARLSPEARAIVRDWCRAGWLHPDQGG